MRSLGTRRVALFTGAVTVAAVALTGCSAGQVAETSLKRPSNQGVNTANDTGSVLIRNLSVGYNGTSGYQPGTDAPLELNLYNQTRNAITVRVSSGAPDAGGPMDVVTATQIGLKGAAAAGASASAAPSPSDSASVAPSASASASAEPATPTAQPASLTIAPMGSVTFLPGDSQTLEAIGLNGKLQPGGQLSLVFEFSDGSPTLKVLAPVSVPLSPAARASGNPDENSED
jgi:hypothetical protein